MAEGPVIEAMQTARAIRHLKPDRVPDELLAKLVFAATRATNPRNEQPWEFIVVTEANPKKEIAKFLEPRASTIRELGQEFESATQRKLWNDAADLIETLAVAPAIMFICGTTMELEAPYSGWEMVGSAVYAAAQNLVVAARSLGLGTTFTTLHLHAESEIRNLLRLPEHVHIRVMLPIGWPDRPFAPVSRRPIEEILHWNHW
jgi:nitroreductase|tara:strand:- start:301 stop:909 length:609 start_codon:yes stop_codon:yes gene_type:complete